VSRLFSVPPPSFSSPASPLLSTTRRMQRRVGPIQRSSVLPPSRSEALFALKRSLDFFSHRCPPSIRFRMSPLRYNTAFKISPHALLFFFPRLLPSSRLWPSLLLLCHCCALRLPWSLSILFLPSFNFRKKLRQFPQVANLQSGLLLTSPHLCFTPNLIGRLATGHLIVLDVFRVRKHVVYNWTFLSPP